MGIGQIGWPQILIVLFIVLLLFGVGRLPQVGRGMGQAIREFRHSVTDKDDEAAKNEPKKEAESKSG